MSTLGGYTYRGRHRAPSNDGARAVAAAAVLASPLAVAAPASAAPASVWDRVADCESSGNWQINTGNGYYGGLQFLPSTWRAFGGTGMPHQASREQQIEVARRTLAVQGPGAWPVCSRKAGLTRENGGATRTPVAAPTRVHAPEPAAPSARSGSAYRVQRGDTLGRIAKRHGVKLSALIAANPAIGNPNLIYPGQRVALP